MWSLYFLKVDSLILTSSRHANFENSVLRENLKFDEFISRFVISQNITSPILHITQ